MLYMSIILQFKNRAVKIDNMFTTLGGQISLQMSSGVWKQEGKYDQRSYFYTI